MGALRSGDSIVEDRLRLQVVTADAFGAAAADHVCALLRQRPAAVIGFPSGSTPRPLYQELVRRHRCGQTDLSRLRAVMLDDYLIATGAGELSFYGRLRSELFDPAGIAPEQILRIPNADAGIDEACRRFEDQVREWGGVDLQLLGLGLNGHIGFNEPGSPFTSRTRVVSLTPASTASNSVYWEAGTAIPPSGVTQGVGTLLEARQIGLLVNGEHKASILRAMLLEPETEAVPASFLRRAQQLWIVADLAAAAELPNRPFSSAGVGEDESKNI